MAAMTLSAAKEIIRSAREAVAYSGKFEGEEPWVAALYHSDWWGDMDDFAGGDGWAWCGLWRMPWNEVPVASEADSSDWFWLFRELRGATCVTISESDDGFVSGWVHFEPVAQVAARMHQMFEPGCPYCGAPLDDEPLELSDGEWVCSGCGAKCALCGDVGLVDDFTETVVDEDTGERGLVCERCCHETA